MLVLGMRVWDDRDTPSGAEIWCLLNVLQKICSGLHLAEEKHRKLGNQVKLSANWTSKKPLDTSLSHSSDSPSVLRKTQVLFPEHLTYVSPNV